MVKNMHYSVFTVKLLFAAILVFYSQKAVSKDIFEPTPYEVETSSQCSRYFEIYEKKYHMPSNMLRAVSVTESGKYSKALNKAVAWPWTINVGGKGYQYESRKEAIDSVKKFISNGKGSIDVGCMQINLKYHPNAFNSLNQAFEPRYNIAYAAKMLATTYSKYGSWETAIRHYHNVNKSTSDKYIARVYESWRREDRSINLALLERPAMSMKVTPTLKEEPQEDFSEITKSVLQTFVQ